MKLILFFVISCLALHNGNGAPTNAVYKFVRCNPEGDQANCVTHGTAKMEWSPELPSKLPASTAEFLEAEAEEGENPRQEEEEEEMLVRDEEGESPVLTEEGSGYEGSGESPFMADWPFVTAEGESGSGMSEKDVERYEGESWSGMSPAGKARPAEPELREEDLLQL
ncbi:serglycin [Centropristis striata]|uniref:serglycin n=1 Tax=Centropristis striata TaxID=184440 RepID=UPI0027E17B91|nr:serglycin [Centropristis striata]